MNMPTFMMMVGLPGSGKSTISGELAKKYDAIVFSSDALREEMFGDINDQNHNQELFAELHKRIKTCLRNGRNAIYDACNINYKRRMAFLSELKGISCEKICVIMATPISVCHERNRLRGRKVPANVITRMFRTFNLPYWYEGWDDIQIEYGKYAKYYGKPTKFYMTYKGFDQRNSHHTLTLGEHCLQVSLKVGYDVNLVYAGILHDCGKPICATTVNKKGKYDGNYHYYDHQYVGCYESLFYDFEDANPIDIAIIIMWHMQPYFNKEEKTKKKYRNLWGEELYEKIMKLHEADIEAH